MHFNRALLPVSALVGLTSAAGCPFADPEYALKARAAVSAGDNNENIAQATVDDSEGFLASDVGGPIEDQGSLKSGPRGPTLLEDFIFRQKIQHFDHERVRTLASKDCFEY